MNVRPIFTRRRITVAAAIAAGAVLVPVAANALNNPSDHYTGCLSTTKGTIAKVKAGDAPLSACSSSEKELTVSGGDITGVTAGIGLTGGSTAGSATLQLAPGYGMPQGCATNTVPKKTATGWTCATLPAPTSDMMGRRLATSNPVSVDGDADTASTFSCGDFPGVSQTGKSANFVLATGLYQPSMTGAARWWINWVKDSGKGFVTAKVQQQLNGTVGTVATWSRADSATSDGGSLPYNQDFGSFYANSNAVYWVEFQAKGFTCGRARLLNASVGFNLIG